MGRKISTTSVTVIKAVIREWDALSLAFPDMVRAERAGGEFVRLDFNSPRPHRPSGVVTYGLLAGQFRRPGSPSSANY
ncbi:hypothetical protein ACYOEI_16595 [Singulisphaera rosea]